MRFLNLGPDGDDLKILVNLPPERRFQPGYLLWSTRVTPPPKPDFTVDPLREKLRQWIAPLPRREPPGRPRFLPIPAEGSRGDGQGGSRKNSAKEAEKPQDIARNTRLRGHFKKSWENGQKRLAIRANIV